MIKYNLKCKNDHEFESWFSNSEEFEKLSRKNLLECIYCSSKKISKSIMAPMVSNLKSDGEQIEILNKSFQNEKNKLLKLRNFIENNFEFVEKDFGKRVREVYYDKKSKKAIYGTTTPEEKEELAEEGIDLLSIPWVNKDN
jgi:hypothetical protein|tara:strand:- start:62 stop:484 length:423 start_codon:yes stop_codon:yes gene_type:complete